MDAWLNTTLGCIVSLAHNHKMDPVQLWQAAELVTEAERAYECFVDDRRQGRAPSVEPALEVARRASQFIAQFEPAKVSLQ